MVRVAELRIYPVKSLRGGVHREARVEPWGLAGDRRWMVVDDTGRFLTQREHARMALIGAIATQAGLRLEAPGEAPVDIAFPGTEAETVAVTVWRDLVPARVASARAAALIGRVIGMSCRLVFLHDTAGRPTNPAYAPASSTVSFADGFPVLIGSLSSLADLNARLATPVTIGRFRPNIVIEGALPWAEDRWRRIRVGGIVFSVVKACERCVVTTIDPLTGERPDKREPLRTLARFRRDETGGVMFGQNAIPENEGVLRAGDTVEILEEGAPNVTFVTAPGARHPAELQAEP